MAADSRDGRVSPTAGSGEAALLERASTVLAEERRRTADERDAFADFRRRVRGVEPTSTPSASGSPAGSPGGVAPRTLADRSAGGGLAAVRDAYRETVMDVPHFEAEYDESYPESVAEEFGPDLAAALVTGDRFDPVCKRTLLDGVEESHSRRETLLNGLDAERESLDAFGERVADLRTELATVTVDGRPVVERVGRATGADDGELPVLASGASFDALAGARGDLCALGERCDTVAADRQAAIHGVARRLSLSVETADVPSYCYAGLPVAYPVLSVVTDLSHRVATCRRAVERAVANAR
jgi:hypothetical protein